jgi:hypothetical protein
MARRYSRKPLCSTLMRESNLQVLK